MKEGLKINSLTLIKNLGKLHGVRDFWLCKCDCGNDCIVSSGNLHSGKTATKSCGCMKYKKKHGACVGGKESRSYSSYRNMLTRCNNPKAPKYEHYGGRGITICERWMGENGFINFLEDMGERPEGMTLDREDVNGNYCKENCKWSDLRQQGFNKRVSPKNTSGRTGVYWCKQRNKWVAYIKTKEKSVNLGGFNSFEDAVKAREEAEIKYFGKVKAECR